MTYLYRYTYLHLYACVYVYIDTHDCKDVMSSGSRYINRLPGIGRCCADCRNHPAPERISIVIANALSAVDQLFLLIILHRNASLPVVVECVEDLCVFVYLYVFKFPARTPRLTHLQRAVHQAPLRRLWDQPCLARFSARATIAYDHQQCVCDLQIA